MALRPSLARSVSIIRQATRVNGFQRRWQSNPRISQASQASWTTGTVLLFSAFASSVAYTYGSRFGNGMQRIELGERAPQYGNAEDLDKVNAHVDELSGPDFRRVLGNRLNMWENRASHDNIPGKSWGREVTAQREVDYPSFLPMFLRSPRSKSRMKYSFA